MLDSERGRDKINVFAKNVGWLFEDVKAAIAANGATSSDAPIIDAERWICVRTNEIILSPDISKTVVHVHDMSDYDVQQFNGAGLVCFTHEIQKYLWVRRGFHGRSCVMPIGSRRNIERATIPPKRPTVGYFTGEVTADIQAKRSWMVIEAIEIARKSLDFDLLMIGRHLGFMEDHGIWLDRAAGPSDYKDVDLLITCTPSPAVPLSVFEACSVGIPIVTTPRWFPSPHWPNIWTADTTKGLSDHIVSILKNREDVFQERSGKSYAPFIFEKWIDFQIEAALSI